jgi:hypothetical protein
MPGLEPGIHSDAPTNWNPNGMDCRVKPGNDDGWIIGRDRWYYPLSWERALGYISGV